MIALRIVRGLGFIWAVVFLIMVVIHAAGKTGMDIDFQSFQFFVLALLCSIAGLLANGQIMAERQSHRLEMIIQTWKNNLEQAEQAEKLRGTFPVRFEEGGPPLLPQRQPLVAGRRFAIMNDAGEVVTEAYA